MPFHAYDKHHVRPRTGIAIIHVYRRILLLFATVQEQEIVSLLMESHIIFAAALLLTVESKSNRPLRCSSATYNVYTCIQMCSSPLDP